MSGRGCEKNRARLPSGGIEPNLNNSKKGNMQKTLGGDRLGAGKKQQVELHGYERSTHDIGYVWRSTMSAGTLVPFLSEVALPGDTMDIKLNADIMTHPTVGPLFGSYKVQLDVFLTPIRLYNSLLHNNALKIGLDMSVVKLPVISMYADAIQADVKDLDNAQINPSCLLSYLGIRGIGITDVPAVRQFNAVPILAYWDIYKNYYANKQEEIGAVIHTPFPTLVQTIDTVTIISPGPVSTALPQSPTSASIPMFTGGRIELAYTGAAPIPNQILINTLERGIVPLEQIATNFGDDGSQVTGTLNLTGWWTATALNWDYIAAGDIPTIAPEVVTFELDNIDKMREQILSWNSKTTPFDIEDSTLEPYIWLSGNQLPDRDVRGSQEGLAIKTYQSDLFNNWLQTEWIDGVDGISAVTAIDTSGGSFTIDTLRLANKVNEMLNRIAVSGGTAEDYYDVVYGEQRFKRCETPMYMGGLSKELVFQEVISNSQTADQPLGTLAGRGVMSSKHKGGDITIKVDEPSYVIGIISLTPRLDYSQGNKWDTTLQTIADLHKPALDEIGFQDLPTQQMAWWDTAWNSGTSEWIIKSAGKQPAWINYMTNINQTRGNFAISTNEMFMTLNRRYEAETNSLLFREIKDLTTYIDPVKFNFIFAETAIDAQNFWAQVAINITARRKMSAKVMPNL